MGLTNGTPVRFQSGNLALEGLLHLPGGAGLFPGAVVCHPHPQYGGDMHNNVVGVLVRACLASGIAALRFNFRGAGLSEGSYEGGDGEVADISTAIGFLCDQPGIDSSRIVLAGYSFGAAMALRYAAGGASLAAVIAVSLPTVAGPTPDFSVWAPLLMVTGDRDEFSDAALLAERAGHLGPDAELQIMTGVDHFWWGSDGRLEAAVTAFLARIVTDG